MIIVGYPNSADFAEATWSSAASVTLPDQNHASFPNQNLDVWTDAADVFIWYEDPTWSTAADASFPTSLEPWPDYS